MPARIRPTLLLTRPRADSLRFARLLPGWQAVIAPILRIVPVDHDAARLRAAGALLFTSAHAVAAAGPGAGRAALCVGGRTAEAARKARGCTPDECRGAQGPAAVCGRAHMPRELM